MSLISVFHRECVFLLQVFTCRVVSGERFIRSLFHLLCTSHKVSLAVILVVARLEILKSRRASSMLSGSATFYPGHYTRSLQKLLNIIVIPIA